MIAYLATLAVGLGVPKRFARAVALTVLILLAVLGLLLAKSCYDGGLIARHDAEREATVARADRQADETAATSRRADDARLSNETIELEKVTAHAPSASDRRLARQRCIRLQQAARAEQREPPACDGFTVPGRAASPDR